MHNMTKFLGTLIVLLLLNSNVLSQTIEIPVAQAKKVLAAAQQNKVNLKKIEVLNDQIAQLNKRIELAQSIIEEYKGKEGNYNEMIGILESQKKDMLAQRKMLEDHIKYLEKQLKKERRKSKFLAAGGIAGIVATVLLTTVLK